MCKVMPQMNDGKEMTVVNSSDVCFGRGKGAYESPGNIKLNGLVWFHLPAYLAAPKNQEKTRISNDIVRTIKQSGGRFLKEKSEKGVYEVVSDGEARLKVAQALRHRRKMWKDEVSSVNFNLSRFFPSPKVDQLNSEATAAPLSSNNTSFAGTSSAVSLANVPFLFPMGPAPNDIPSMAGAAAKTATSSEKIVSSAAPSSPKTVPTAAPTQAEATKPQLTTNEKTLLF